RASISARPAPGSRNWSGTKSEMCSAAPDTPSIDSALPFVSPLFAGTLRMCEGRKACPASAPNFTQAISGYIQPMGAKRTPAPPWYWSRIGSGRRRNGGRKSAKNEPTTLENDMITFDAFLVFLVAASLPVLYLLLLRRWIEPADGPTRSETPAKKVKPA